MFLDIRIIIYIFYNVRDRTIQQKAQLIDSICADAVAFLNGVVGRFGKSLFEKCIGSNILFRHSFKERTIADHDSASLSLSVYDYCIDILGY